MLAIPVGKVGLKYHKQTVGIKWSPGTEIVHTCGLLVQCLHSSMFGLYGRHFHGNIMLDELQRAIGSLA